LPFSSVRSPGGASTASCCWKGSTGRWRWRRAPFIAIVPLAVVASAFAPAEQSFGDRLVERFELDGEAAASVRELFATPSDVRSAATAVGLVALVVTCLSFARSLQRAYAQIWELEPLGLRGSLRGLVWVGGFALWLAFAVPVRDVLRELGGTTLYFLVTVAASSLIWGWTPYVLLGGRIEWRRLVPTAILAGFGLSALTAASILYTPAAIERSADAYGLIGVTFAFVSLLFAFAVVIIAAAVIGAEASSSPPRLRRRDA
jgi:membrane protein